MSARLNRSRLEVRLEAEIVKSPLTVEADCKRAELAAYRARLGRVDEARTELTALHEKYDRRPNVMVSAWLNLTDGLVHHHHVGLASAAAREKILRSHALSSAARLPRMQALGSAWLAALDYLDLNIAAMVRHACESLRLSAFEDHATRSLVSLVVAQAYHAAGRLDLAGPWYAVARIHAGLEGDEATLSALMHGMAWIRAQQCRAHALQLTPHAPVETHALLNIESVANFALLFRSISVSAWIAVVRAQVLTVHERYAEALAVYDASLEVAIGKGVDRRRGDLIADKAWCRSQLGQSELAWKDAFDAEACIDSCVQCADRALAHARLAKVFRFLGDDARGVLHQGLALSAWSGHERIQGQILEALEVVGQPDWANEPIGQP